jgi:glycosyltransferase involved in cell wall biosynthesis
MHAARAHRKLDAYFSAATPEGGDNRVVTAGADMQAVRAISTLSVLLNSRDVRVPMVWLGPVPKDGHAQLNAAGVRVCDPADDEGRAALLAGALAFIHMWATHQPALALLQAMAAGLPCLVSNVPAHRALVRHGETGILCRRERDYLDALVLLLRNPAARRRLGAAARAAAERSAAPQPSIPPRVHLSHVR